MGRPLALGGLIWVATLGVVTPAFTQEAPPPRFEDLVEVSEVLLDVLALDRQGRVVRGLGPADFVVREDGEAVEVTGASFYTSIYEDPISEDPIDEDPAAASPEPPGRDSPAVEVPASRFFVFFFHRQLGGGGRSLSRGPVRQLQAARAAWEWMKSEMAPSDWAAVVSFDRRLRVRQDFTQDLPSLELALDAASRGVRVRKDAPPPRRAADAFSLLAHLPRPEVLDVEARRIYDAVRLVADAMRPIVGRKNLLLFTLGFGELEPGLFFDSRPDLSFYPPMREALNHANVALYPIDLNHPSITHSDQGLLRTLAIDTGAIYVAQVPSFSALLESIGRQTLGYYLLSFRTLHRAGTSGYRRITVESARPGVRVLARRGYRYGS